MKRPGVHHHCPSQLLLGSHLRRAMRQQNLFKVRGLLHLPTTVHLIWSISLPGEETRRYKTEMCQRPAGKSPRGLQNKGQLHALTPRVLHYLVQGRPPAPLFPLPTTWLLSQEAMCCSLRGHCVLNKTSHSDLPFACPHPASSRPGTILRMTLL